MKIIRHIYSINFNKFERSPKRIVYIIFHYTGMLSEKKAIKRFKQNRRIRLIAEVKRENLASCKVFEKIGFRKSLKVKYGVNIFSYKL